VIVPTVSKDIEYITITSLSASLMSGNKGSDFIVTVGMPPIIFWLLGTIGGKSFESLFEWSDDEFNQDAIFAKPTRQTNCVQTPTQYYDYYQNRSRYDRTRGYQNINTVIRKSAR